MNINLHIDRLILDGLPLEAGGAALLQAAVEAELGRLLVQGGLSGELLNGGALPYIRAGGIELADRPNPTQLGGQIAHAVYAGIGKK